MTGVMTVNAPSTRTVTVLPSAGAQVGEQLRLTPAGASVTKDPFASLRVRHMTRFVALSHAPPDTNEPGLTAASMAPSRAALDSVIDE